MGWLLSCLCGRARGYRFSILQTVLDSDSVGPEDCDTVVKRESDQSSFVAGDPISDPVLVSADLPHFECVSFCIVHWFCSDLNFH